LDSIGDGAFVNCQLDSISIPASVHAIGKHCFDGCRALSQVHFAPVSKLTEIHASTFAKCPALKSIVMPDSVRVRLGLRLLRWEWGQFIVVEPDFATVGFGSVPPAREIERLPGDPVDVEDEFQVGYQMLLHDFMINEGGRQILAQGLWLVELFCGSLITA
jgi:hypothetical protein